MEARYFDQNLQPSALDISKRFNARYSQIRGACVCLRFGLRLLRSISLPVRG